MRVLPLLVLAGGAYWFWSTQTVANDAEPDALVTSAVPDFNDGLDDEGYYVDSNLTALLATVRRSEVSTAGDDGYAVFYGGSTFSNFADHPCVTGEKAGVKLPDRFCLDAGLSPGCVSTAAGGYQINKPTWLDARQDKGDGFGYLGDFTPASQDIAATRLLRATGAVDALQAGDFDGAIRAAATRWASLAGSTSGQPQHSMATLLSWFASSGGSVA